MTQVREKMQMSRTASQSYGVLCVFDLNKTRLFFNRLLRDVATSYWPESSALLKAPELV